MGVNKSDVKNYCKTNKNFAQVPNCIWDVTNISMHAKMVWIYLAAQGPKWQSSIRSLATNLGVHRKTVDTALKLLAKKNMLSMVNAHYGTNFTLHAPSTWNVKWGGQTLHKQNTAMAHANGQPWGTSGVASAQSAAHTVARIQNNNITNMTNTANARRSGKVKKSHLSYQDKDNIPEDWKDHFLKSSIFREHFLNLPSDEQLGLWRAYPHYDDKDDFLSEMQSRIYTNSTQSLEVDIDSL
jgi:hypothetical protein